jgi:hypothetical protein
MLSSHDHRRPQPVILNHFSRALPLPAVETNWPRSVCPVYIRSRVISRCSGHGLTPTGHANQLLHALQTSPFHLAAVLMKINSTTNQGSNKKASSNPFVWQPLPPLAGVPLLPYYYWLLLCLQYYKYKRYSPNPTTIPPITYPGILPC